MINDYDGVYILQDDEEPNPLYGMEIYTITPNVIACLQAGKRIYIPVNDEYAVVLKMDELRTAFSSEDEYNKFPDKLERIDIDAIRD